ncbi:hypothetical protein Shyhy01_24840 [Streptomyces hygroscopicus subsp. hygroscopicus]|nr:hypothetical protein Shyhy01_24840 [Streptomyces hygroscopicus subsp. hygroscopicus]
MRSRRDRTHEENIISAIHKTLSGIAVTGVVLAGATACGTVEQLSAGRKLDRAFEKLGEKKTVSFELDLDTDATSLKALDAGSHPKPGEEMPDEAAELLSGAKVRVTVQSKKPIGESGEKDLVGTALKVSGPDGDLIECRVIGDYTYLRADPDALGKMTGSPMPTAEDLPPQAGAMKDVLNGKWVKFSNKETRNATGEGRRAKGGPAPARSLDAKTQKKLVRALREVIAREVRFRTADGGDGTEHITATAPFRTLVGELLREIRPLAKDLPPGVGLPTDEDLKDAPDTKVTADFTLKNGELSEMNVDLAKLADNAEVKKLGLTLRTGQGSKPTAPVGATELNLDELAQGFFGSGAAGDAEFDDGDLRDLGGQDFPQDGS